jgi:hypothetical protein
MVEARCIGVSVHAGVVTLVGWVTSNAERAAANAAVRRVEGVALLTDATRVALPALPRRKHRLLRPERALRTSPSPDSPEASAGAPPASLTPVVAGLVVVIDHAGARVYALDDDASGEAAPTPEPRHFQHHSEAAFARRGSRGDLAGR